MTSTQPLDDASELAAEPKRPVAWLSVVVFIAVLALTGSLVWSTASIHQHNESRLLDVELHQAASVVSASIPSIESPLISAADLATISNGNAQQFSLYMRAFVGGGSLFVNASLWHITGSGPTLLASVGLPTSQTAIPPGGVAAFVASLGKKTPIAVSNLLSASIPTIAYAASSQFAPGTWVVFGDTVLPKNRKLTITQNPAFSQLTYAIYLGKTTDQTHLLAASPGGFSLGTGAVTASIPVGNTVITMKAKATGELGGPLLARLPWIVAIAGGALALVAAVISEYLVRRRRQAEWLASENRRMYREQLNIAGILQGALLPQELPAIVGVETAARYVAGRRGTDVGGDWYDVIPLDDSRFVFVVGDVSGHGVVAATIMARLHFAIRAYAAQGDAPETILTKLGQLLSLEKDKSFATILCGVVNVTDHTITLVNAGHPPPLLMNDKQGDFVRTVIFPPVGVLESTDYHSVTLTVPQKATIFAFTDGLVERRGEIIDVGLERLRSLVVGTPLVLDDLLSKVVDEMRDGGFNDDMAILAVKWTS
jgi:hypothetical protein